MKLVLFGGNGQVGSEIRLRAPGRGIEVVAPSSSEVDITEERMVAKFIDTHEPQAVINCAAYTAVDKAESESELAKRINEIGSRNIASAAAKHGARLIFVSTDYVFDGTLGRALHEHDAVNPQSVYGKTKLAGELASQEETQGEALIVRTSSVYGAEGVNFVSTMLRLLRERDTLSIVSDQWMSPTWAGWLGATLLDLLRYDVAGVIHASCAGATTWYNFAEQIRDLTKVHTDNDKNGELIAVTAAEYGALAPRPAYSVLDCGKLSKLLGAPILQWNEGLKAYLEEIGYGPRFLAPGRSDHISYRSINRLNKVD